MKNVLSRGVAFSLSSTGLAAAVLLTAAFGHRPTAGEYNTTPTQRARAIQAFVSSCHSCGCLETMTDYIRGETEVPAYDAYIYGRCRVARRGYGGYGGYDSPLEPLPGYGYGGYEDPADPLPGYGYGYDNDPSVPGYGYDGYGSPGCGYGYNGHVVIPVEPYPGYGYGYDNGSGYDNGGYGYGYASRLRLAPYDRESTLESLRISLSRLNETHGCALSDKVHHTMLYLDEHLD